MQFRRVIDNPEGICILHNDPGIAQNLEITEQKSELTITNLTVYTFILSEVYNFHFIRSVTSVIFHFIREGFIPKKSC